MYLKDIVGNKYYLKYNKSMSIQQIREFYSEKNGLSFQFVVITLNDEILHNNFILKNIHKIDENTVFMVKCMRVYYYE